MTLSDLQNLLSQWKSSQNVYTEKLSQIVDKGTCHQPTQKLKHISSTIFDSFGTDLTQLLNAISNEGHCEPSIVKHILQTYAAVSQQLQNAVDEICRSIRVFNEDIDFVVQASNQQSTIDEAGKSLDDREETITSLKNKVEALQKENAILRESVQNQDRRVRSLQKALHNAEAETQNLLAEQQSQFQDMFDEKLIAYQRALKKVTEALEQEKLINAEKDKLLLSAQHANMESRSISNQYLNIQDAPLKLLMEENQHLKERIALTELEQKRAALDCSEAEEKLRAIEQKLREVQEADQQKIEALQAKVESSQAIAEEQEIKFEKLQKLLSQHDAREHIGSISNLPDKPIELQHFHEQSQISDAEKNTQLSNLSTSMGGQTLQQCHSSAQQIDQDNKQRKIDLAQFKQLQIENRMLIQRLHYLQDWQISHSMARDGEEIDSSNLMKKTSNRDSSLPVLERRAYAPIADEENLDLSAALQRHHPQLRRLTFIERQTIRWGYTLLGHKIGRFCIISYLVVLHTVMFLLCLHHPDKQPQS